MTSETESEESRVLGERDAKLLALVDERFAVNGPLFNSLEHARAQRRAHVVCIGDSHLFVFREELPHRNVARLMPQVWFEPCIVAGATARGLVNPWSRSNARNVFRRRIELAEPWQPVILQLGEVDCGFLIWSRADQSGESVDTQFERSIESYLTFIDEIRGRGFGQVIVLSAPLPTIQDGQDWGEVAHARRSISVPQRDRTDLTLRYNAELARRAGDYTFVDVTEATLDPATGLIADLYAGEQRTDHHLAPEPYSRLIVERLGPLLAPP